MHHFTVESVQAVAKDVRSVFASADSALHDAARLMIDFLVATEQADVCPAKTQKTLKAVSASIERIIEGRAELIRAHQTMTVLKDNSNLEVVDFGCWFGRKSDGKLTLVPVAA